jgi:hypothetical protein
LLGIRLTVNNKLPKLLYQTGVDYSQAAVAAVSSGSDYSGIQAGQNLSKTEGKRSVSSDSHGKSMDYGLNQTMDFSYPTEHNQKVDYGNPKGKKQVNPAKTVSDYSPAKQGKKGKGLLKGKDSSLGGNDSNKSIRKEGTDYANSYQDYRHQNAEKEIGNILDGSDYSETVKKVQGKISQLGKSAKKKKDLTSQLGKTAKKGLPLGKKPIVKVSEKYKMLLDYTFLLLSEKGKTPESLDRVIVNRVIHNDSQVNAAESADSVNGSDYQDSQASSNQSDSSDMGSDKSGKFSSPNRTAINNGSESASSDYSSSGNF